MNLRDQPTKFRLKFLIKGHSILSAHYTELESYNLLGVPSKLTNAEVADHCDSMVKSLVSLHVELLKQVHEGRNTEHALALIVRINKLINNI